MHASETEKSREAVVIDCYHSDILNKRCHSPQQRFAHQHPRMEPVVLTKSVTTPATNSGKCLAHEKQFVKAQAYDEHVTVRLTATGQSTSSGHEKAKGALFAEMGPRKIANSTRSIESQANKGSN